MSRTLTLALLAALPLAGCANTGQLATNMDATNFSLDPVAFRSQGIGFLTPTSATGQEANRLALALAFASSLENAPGDLRVVPLAEVLSAVNRAGLAAGYKAMMDDYEATGIMERDMLRQVGDISDARYLGLLQLAAFDQSENRRFSIAGLRLMDTKLASIRVSWEIWDSATGTIAWEGSNEIHYAYDTGRERPVSFGFVAGKAAASLIAAIPDAPVGETAAASVLHEKPDIPQRPR